MGRLVVEAQGTAAEGPIVQGVAAVGNSDPMSLIVSVTDADGVPVSGLVAAVFFLAVTRGVDQGQTVCAVLVH